MRAMSPPDLWPGLDVAVLDVQRTASECMRLAGNHRHRAVAAQPAGFPNGRFEMIAVSLYEAEGQSA